MFVIGQNILMMSTNILTPICWWSLEIIEAAPPASLSTLMLGSGKFQNNRLLLQSKPWVLHQFLGHNASVSFPHLPDVAILTRMETAGWDEVSTRRIQIACGPRSHIVWSVKNLELVADPRCISHGFRNTICPSLFIPVLCRAPIEKAPILQSVVGNNNRHGNSQRFEGKQMFLGFPSVLKEQQKNMPCLSIFSTQKQKWGRWGVGGETAFLL